ncbi:hypothetical protein SDC9_115349 [bioreactor metagenome]|uniref:Uncharacterized protein n=1 Tax=bioreactor metagenome TaxID=1076179 RepID=A0A645BT74_9ZZZZ
MRRSQRPGRAVHNGSNGRRHDHVLGGTSPQEVRPEPKVDQPQNRKCPRLHHRHRMEQRGHRRGGHGCIRQPSAKGEDCRFYAKAEKCQHEHRSQHGLMSRRLCKVQHPTVGKVQRRPVAQHKHDADKRERRPREGVHQIFPPGIPCLLVHEMHHQRQR